MRSLLTQNCALYTCSRNHHINVKTWSNNSVLVRTMNERFITVLLEMDATCDEWGWNSLTRKWGSCWCNICQTQNHQSIQRQNRKNNRQGQYFPIIRSSTWWNHRTRPQPNKQNTRRSYFLIRIQFYILNCREILFFFLFVSLLQATRHAEFLALETILQQRLWPQSDVRFDSISNFTLPLVGDRFVFISSYHSCRRF